MKRYGMLLLILLAAGWLVACGGSDYQNDDTDKPPADGDAPDGDTPDGDEEGDLPEFISAGAGEGGNYDETPGRDGDDGAEAPDEDNDGGEREIVESDLFRVIGNHIYALNQFRGLAVVDFTNPAKPSIVSRLALRGFPKEMFVDDGIAVILLTNLTENDPENGRYRIYSEVVTVDVSNPASPAIIETFPMTGTIVDSRKVGDIVYAVSSVQPWWYWCDDSESNQASIEIAAINIADPNDIHLADTETFPGYGWAIYVTQNTIYVAETWDYWNERTQGSLIHYVDISDPAGTMEKRSEFRAHALVLDRFKMYQKGDTFVVVSVTTGWNGDTFLETFDVSDPTNVTRQAILPIMENEQLYATRFSGDRAYIVTFEQTDPLFVAEFSNPEAPVVLGELEIPGWSTHMEIRGDKIYAVGVDDQGGWRTKVSLFDVADPENLQELATVSIGDEGTYSWSEALYDWKAFRIYDDLGFMLVPTSGYDGNWYAYVNKLNLIDFTDTTLTLRGHVVSESPVKRGFVAGDYLASLSDTTLQLIDFSDRDKLDVLSEVVLASFVYRLDRCGDVLCTTDNGYWTANSKLRLFDPADPGDAPYWQSDILSQQFGYGGSSNLLKSDNNPHIFLTTYSYGGWWGEDGGVDRGFFDKTEGRKIFGFDLSDPSKPVFLGEGSLPQDENYYYYETFSSLLPGDVLVNSSGWQWDSNYRQPSFSLKFSDLSDLANITTLEQTDALSPLFPWQPMPVVGSSVWATDCSPVPGNDGRPAVKCFAVKFDASNKDDIKQTARFNTPGQAVAFSSDKTRLLSLDRQFTGQKDGYLTCTQSLRVLAMSGDRPTSYLGEIPLTEDQYCYWLGNDGNDDTRPTEPDDGMDGDVPEPADGCDSDADCGPGEVCTRGYCEYTEGDSNDGEGSTPKGRPAVAGPPAESYTYFSGWHVLGDRVYVLHQTYSYSYDEPTDYCGYNYSSSYKMNVVVYSLSNLAEVDRFELDNVYSASPVSGGGLLFAGSSRSEGQIQNRLIYLANGGKQTELAVPEADGYNWYYSYYGASVRIGSKLYVPNGWYGIQTYTVTD